MNYVTRRKFREGELPKARGVLNNFSRDAPSLGGK